MSNIDPRAINGPISAIQARDPHADSRDGRDMSAVVGIDETTLEEDEEIIERGLTTFIAVGGALLRIREGQKYRGRGHATFAGYCAQRWGFGRAHAYRLMDAAQVVGELSPLGDIAAPTSERHVRELARLPDAQTRRTVWRMVIEEHGEGVAAAQVQDAVGRYVRGKELKEREAEIDRGIPHIAAAGTALAHVRDAGLYRETHATFEEYCRDHLRLEPAMVRAMMDAEGVA